MADTEESREIEMREQYADLPAGWNAQANQPSDGDPALTYEEYLNQLECP